MSEEVATLPEPPITDLVEVESNDNRVWTDETKTQLLWGCRKYRCKKCQKVSPVLVGDEALRNWISKHNCVATQ